MNVFFFSIFNSTKRNIDFSIEQWPFHFKIDNIYIHFIQSEADEANVFMSSALLGYWSVHTTEGRLALCENTRFSSNNKIKIEFERNFRLENCTFCVV